MPKVSNIEVSAWVCKVGEASREEAASSSWSELSRCHAVSAAGSTAFCQFQNIFPQNLSVFVKLSVSVQGWKTHTCADVSDFSRTCIRPARTSLAEQEVAFPVFVIQYHHPNHCWWAITGFVKLVANSTLDCLRWLKHESKNTTFFAFLFLFTVESQGNWAKSSGVRRHSQTAGGEEILARNHVALQPVCGQVALIFTHTDWQRRSKCLP